MYQFRSYLSNDNTRNDEDPHIPKVKLKFSRKDFDMLVLGLGIAFQKELSSLILFKKPSRKASDGH